MKQPSRRAVLALGVAALATACRDATDARVLRLGYLPNLTHAPALTGVASGRFASSLAPVQLVTQSFHAGPAAVEALLAGALDAVYVGPAPVLVAWARTGGHVVRVVAGAASGGASLVTRPGVHVRTATDLRGLRVATPQLGNTQDVALREYLRAHGLASTDHGGDVTVVPLPNPDIVARLRLGQLDAAWIPEPWVARAVAEAGAALVLDERDLWPRRSFPTTVLVVQQDYLRDAPGSVQKLLRAHADEVAHLRADPVSARAEANRALAQLQGRGLSPAVLAAAWSRVEFTTDPLADALARSARAARALGFLSRDDTAGLVDLAPLARALAQPSR